MKDIYIKPQIKIESLDIGEDTLLTLSAMLKDTDANLDIYTMDYSKTY